VRNLGWEFIIYNQFNYCSRVLLAVMHFNENSNRQSKISRDGKEQYSIHYPKYRKGDPIVRRIKTAPTHSKLPFVL
jgi:receptor-type tyrosine-protein phosphatase zeta